MNPFVVATECPSCGAPLDFTEGSNVLKCQHCRSNLLITGRKRVLSYYVPPQLSERVAVAKAFMEQRNKGHEGFREITSQLYFIPYYRLTGQDFGWAEPLRETKEDEETERTLLSAISLPHDQWIEKELYPEILEAAGDFIGEILNEALGKSPDDSRTVRGDLNNRQEPAEEIPQHPGDSFGRINAAQTKKGTLYENGKVCLKERYIEKNFLACKLEGLGLYSLGVRPSVLRLELFRGEVIAPLGKVVAPDTGPEVAEATGMKRAAEQPLLYREVIGKVLSIVYFPFWVVEMHTARNTLLTILDAVSQSVVRSVVRTETPDSIYSVFNNPLKGTPEIVGFRPITCPNCGWDLPVRPDDAIFFCTTCGSAWQIEGKELFGVRHTFAEIGYFSSDCEIRYLPFWVLLTERIESESFRFFIPGFRCRRLKFLLDLALRISRLQPVYSPSEQKGVEPSSCCYDREDASLLARFTQACLLSRRIEDFRDAAKHAVSVKNAELVCFPFRLQGEYLIAPFGDMAIPKGLLL